MTFRLPSSTSRTNGKLKAGNSLAYRLWASVRICFFLAFDGKEAICMVIHVARLTELI